MRQSLAQRMMNLSHKKAQQAQKPPQNSAAGDSRATSQARRPMLPIRNFKLIIAYDGTNYAGWQLQPNGVSVQELLEKALEKIAGQEIRVHGSGRTDAGVHARGQVASFSLTTPKVFGAFRSPLILQRALNANLPDDVRVLSCVTAKAKFHARFSAKAKEYRYQIDCGEVADPFLRRYALHHPRPLDLLAVRRAAKLLIGKHDFTALSAHSPSRDHNPVRTISRLTIAQRGNLLIITVRADGFLYKMARSIVGALLKVGEGRTTTEQLREIMRGKKRTPLVETVPAHGLFLWKVFY
jgi:tRNA pseudouridine38-40 synthase